MVTNEKTRIGTRRELKKYAKEHKDTSANTKEGKGIPRNVPRNMSGNDKEQ